MDASKITFKQFAGVDESIFDFTDDDHSPSTLAVNFHIQISELADILNLSSQSIIYELKKLNIDYTIVSRSAYLSQSQTRKYLEYKGFTHSKISMTFLMLKGGVGKTSTSFNLAIMLNKLGGRVLYVDLDPQGNATNWFTINTAKDSLPIFVNIIRNETSAEDCIVNISEGLDLLPSDFDNAPCDFEITLHKKNYTTLVSKALDNIKDNYDYIIIDCNPTLSTINESAALASDVVIIPVTPDSFSKSGLKETLKDLWRISRESGKFIDFKILVNMFEKKTSTAKKYKAFFENNFSENIIRCSIQNNTDIKRTCDEKKSIFDKKSATSIEDFLSLTLEVSGLDHFIDQIQRQGQAKMKNDSFQLSN